MTLIGAAEVVVQDVAEEAFEHFLFGGQGLQGIEFILDTSVEVLHDAVEPRGSDGDGGMAGPVALLDQPGKRRGALGLGVAEELRAVVGLDGRVMDVHAVAEEMLKEQVDEAEGVDLGAFVGEADVGDPGGDVLSGVLIAGEALGLDGGQQGREVVEMFRVDLELLEGAHGLADLRGEPAALPAFPPGLDQGVGVQDPVDRGGGQVHAAPGQEDLDLVLPQARVSSAEAHDLAFDGGSRFMGRAVVAAAVQQRRPPALLVALDPEADGLAVAAEGTGGQGDGAALQVVLDEALADAPGVAGVGDAFAVSLQGHELHFDERHDGDPISPHKRFHPADPEDRPRVGSFHPTSPHPYPSLN